MPGMVAQFAGPEDLYAEAASYLLIVGYIREAVAAEPVVKGPS